MEKESVRLNEEAARRLIQRATELDASLSTQSSVAELREAARGAGISDEAFQRALDEARAEAAAVPPPLVKRTGIFPRNKFLLAAAIALILIGMLLAVRMAVPVPFVESPAVQPEVVSPLPPPGEAPAVPPPTTTPPPTTPPVGPAPSRR